MARPLYPSILSGFEAWDGDVQDVIDILKNPLPIKEVPSLANLAALETAFAAASYDRCIVAAQIGGVWSLYFSNGTAWFNLRGEDHGAAVYLNADQSIPDNVDTRIDVDTVEHDPDSLYDAATFSIKIKLAGTYLIGGNVTSAAAAVGSRIASLCKNGTAVRKAKLFPDAVDQQTYALTPKRIVLAVNDLITIKFHQTSGAGLNVIGHGTDAALRCEIWVQKVDRAG